MYSDDAIKLPWWFIIMVTFFGIAMPIIFVAGIVKIGEWLCILF